MNSKKMLCFMILILVLVLSMLIACDGGQPTGGTIGLPGTDAAVSG